ncbi:hypothetical protein ACFV06_31455 [Streptomyces sp. NPDC059618]|uniref:hypothetical protein n=1 Tax=Streptomyces sp. NPDC059618 TaxID=3346887 RepID=UPI0036AEC80B
MEQHEIMQRVIAILTEVMERRRLKRENPSRSDVEESGLISDLLTEMMPPITIPAGATSQEIAAAVNDAIAPAVEGMAAAFALAFVTMAETHDAGQDDATSQDVLQSLALDTEH